MFIVFACSVGDSFESDFLNLFLTFSQHLNYFTVANKHEKMKVV